MQQTDAGKTVADVLAVLSEKFGTTADHLWAVLVRQQYVYGVTAALLASLCAVAAFWLGRYAYRHINAPTEKYAYTDQSGYFIGLVIAVLFAGLGIGWTYDAITMFLNPEYGALKDVLNALTPRR